MTGMMVMRAMVMALLVGSTAAAGSAAYALPSMPCCRALALYVGHTPANKHVCTPVEARTCTCRPPHPHRIRRAPQSEANELEVELLEELQAATLPRAAAIYSAAPRGDDIAASDDEGASSEEEGAEEEEAGSDSEEAAARRAALRQRKEQAGARPWWRISRGGALILLLVLMLAGQYLALILHLTGG